MALPVVESFTTNTATSSSSLVLTKPTGLAVGDLLVEYQQTTDGSTTSFNTPAGWTLRGIVNMSDSLRGYGVYTKVADSADVAASNFTFTTDVVVDTYVGILLRVSNVAEIQAFDIKNNAPSSTTMSFTGTVTPKVVDSLLLLGVSAWSGDGGGAVSAYTSTPSRSFTEVADITLNSGTTDPVIAVASAPLATIDAITAYGATLTVSKTQHSGSLLLLTPPTSPTVDVGHTAITPTVEGVTATQVNTTADVGHTAVVPTINGVSGEATAPTAWTTITKT